MRSCWRALPGLRASCSTRPSLSVLPSPSPPHYATAQHARALAGSYYMYPASSQRARQLHGSPAPSRVRSSGPPPKGGAPPPTSFGDLDVLGATPAPATSVDVCMHDGFGLNSGATISGGDGALLVNGRAFAWRPWETLGDGGDAARGDVGKGRSVMNGKGQFDLPREAFGMFDVLWPRPDLLVIGVGKHNMPLSPETRRHVAELGMRVEVLDTRNAAAQFNLLATERGVSEVAAALIPLGWVDGRFEE
ncbi:NADH dehydrogenase 1 alpha subcomplex assembly factor 3 [Escovopsis weberi]|uniref:NADH dehydrogenase 1 alpha subcomplex assembly factor 3 n=1 Tax=Escovopsis weberi TaxID=150374 RepID=A0A0M9VVH5_ESCWE|nr:NADH dehydrogenase 1 alpha subcomplex assembly factor 3 [Escovopsis weberi]